jgi:hypothetical protein
MGNNFWTFDKSPALKQTLNNAAQTEQFKASS